MYFFTNARRRTNNKCRHNPLCLKFSWHNPKFLVKVFYNLFRVETPLLATAVICMKIVSCIKIHLKLQVLVSFNAVMLIGGSIKNSFVFFCRVNILNTEGLFVCTKTLREDSS